MHISSASSNVPGQYPHASHPADVLAAYDVGNTVLRSSSSCTIVSSLNNNSKHAFSPAGTWVLLLPLEAVLVVHAQLGHRRHNMAGAHVDAAAEAGSNVHRLRNAFTPGSA